MAKIGELIVKIGADMTNLTKGLEDSQKKLQNFGSKVKAIGGTMTAAVTLPLAAAGAAAFKLAADMEDAMGATQIFKSSSKEMQKWASNLESYYGIAKGEALEYGNMMGSMLQNIGGLTEIEAAKQAQTLIKLAGDLTAMYGGTAAEAVRALTGALKGNNTMLDNYGMAVNDVMIKTKALEMGLIAEGGQLSLQAKQAATLALIMEQTGAAQGQAAREAEGASGTMRALTTEIKNLTASLGESLLPVITPVIAKLNDLMRHFSAMSPETQKIIVVIAGMAAALGPLLLAVSAVTAALPYLGAAVMALGSPIGIAIMVIVGAGIAVIRNWEDVKRIGLNAWGQLKIGVLDAISAILNYYTKLWGWLPIIGQKIKETNQQIQASINDMRSNEQSIIDSRNIEKGIKKHEDTARAAGKKLGESMKAGVQSVIPDIPSAITGTGSGGGVGGINSAAAKVEKDMTEIGKYAAKGLTLGMGEGVKQSQVLSDALKSLKTQIEELNKQYEISYYATGANSDATKQLREQIAELAKQYDALTASIGNAAGVQQKMSLSQTLMSYAGSANSSNADYTAELIKQTITNSKIDWSKEKIGIEIGGRWAPKLPNFDGGGIVPGPIGRPQLAIVHGGEEVRTPQQQQKTGGDVKIDINIHDATDPQKVGQIVRTQVTQVFRDLALGGAY